jgi:hypothetical protein
MRYPANRNIAISLLALAWLLLLSVGSFAAEKAGTVTHLSGPLFAKKSDGTTRVLSTNSIVEEGDTLITEKGTYGRIKFTDNSEITLRPNTQIKITHYSFNEDKPKEDSAVYALAKGGLRAVTGLIGKRGDPDSYKVNTPVGTIGIRGTDWGALYCQSDCGDYKTSSGQVPNNGLYVDVVSGKIVVVNNLGSQEFSPGQFGYVTFNKPPVILPPGSGVPISTDKGINKPPPFQDVNKGKQTDCIVR